MSYQNFGYWVPSWWVIKTSLIGSPHDELSKLRLLGPLMMSYQNFGFWVPSWRVIKTSVIGSPHNELSKLRLLGPLMMSYQNASVFGSSHDELSKYFSFWVSPWWVIKTLVFWRSNKEGTILNLGQFYCFKNCSIIIIISLIFSPKFPSPLPPVSGLIPYLTHGPGLTSS